MAGSEDRKGSFRTEVLTVSPLLAREWLEKNRNFRKVSEGRVEKLAKDIASGKWDLNGESIKFDPDGNLIDGQHRLSAVVLANKPIQTAVCFGVKSDLNVDSGASRRGEMWLNFHGYKFCRDLWSASRWLLDYENGRWGDATPKNYTNAEVLSYIKKNPDLQGVVSTYRNFKKMGLMGLIHAFYYVTWRLGEEHIGTRSALEDFTKKLQDGERLTRTDPIFILREKLLNPKKGNEVEYNQTERLALLIKTWNGWLDGRPSTGVQWRGVGRNAEKFPTILVHSESLAEEESVA